ncbi:TIGR04219 family outer membrane beta-barrel protein [Catenovulum sp. SM1970]|uniref:TIGR04219 family outer membrane beta-barrel protein n=1 Tax=Marinifaba aquimaris TaxID=2741323 RepID=UPI001572A90A|nr:TIGR04219 family outer membrane beta-barrel protein [Marinifaba aquimaris]NTS76775.1 TIGR04219 family outer membrane beta-barrel protein [Marinifaba aquimaris]
MKITSMAKAGLLASALAGSVAQADTIYGLYLGAQGWNVGPEGSFESDQNSLTPTSADFSYDDETATSFYIALEHPVPLLPNIKFRNNDMDISGSVKGTLNFDGVTFTDTAATSGDLTNSDYILYYEVLDNGVVSLDLGINGKHIDGELTVQGKDIAGNPISGTEAFDGVVPMAYASAEIGLPFTGLAVFGDFSYASYDGHTLADYQIGVEYELIDNIAFDISVHAGYRAFELELDDLDGINSDLDATGVFGGVQLHF